MNRKLRFRRKKSHSHNYVPCAVFFQMVPCAETSIRITSRYQNVPFISQNVPSVKTPIAERLHCTMPISQNIPYSKSLSLRCHANERTE